MSLLAIMSLIGFVLSLVVVFIPREDFSLKLTCSFHFLLGAVVSVIWWEIFFGVSIIIMLINLFLLFLAFCVK